MKKLICLLLGGVMLMLVFAGCVNPGTKHEETNIDTRQEETDIGTVSMDTDADTEFVTEYSEQMVLDSEIIPDYIDVYI